MLHAVRPVPELVRLAAAAERLGAAAISHTGEFTASHARLDWAPGRLPLAIAGRGPRVERLSFIVADIDSDYRRLADRGVEFISPPWTSPRA